MTTRIVYLHGFASGPQSRKARYFQRKFAERGVEFHAPPLDDGAFERLTVTGELQVVDRTVAGRPAILMGSSLGGYLAAWYASRHPHIERLVLLAPALRFKSGWRERFSEAELAAWKRQGTAPFFYYPTGVERSLGYRFYEDSQVYDDQPEFAQPALVLHGTRDDIVPAEDSRAYAAAHPNVLLRLFDSGHELTDVLDQIWAEVERFLMFQNP